MSTTVPNIVVHVGLPLARALDMDSGIPGYGSGFGPDHGRIRAVGRVWLALLIGEPTGQGGRLAYR